MSFVDRLEKIQQEQELTSTFVPEWNEMVYGKPLTMKQLELADRYGNKAESVFARLAKIAQFVLRDEGGGYLVKGQQEFERFHKSVDGEVLARVLRELGMLSDDDDLETVEKNSARTPDED